MKKFVLSTVYLLLFILSSCNSRSIENGNVNNGNAKEGITIQGQDTTGEFQLLVASGIDEMRQFENIKYFNPLNDSLVAKGLDFEEGLKKINNKIQFAETKKPTQCQTLFVIRYNKVVGNYYECLMGNKQKSYYLMFKEYSDSSAILVPFIVDNVGKIKRLNSFFYVDYKNGKCLCLSFNCFNSLEGELSLSRLNTISFLNPNLYEKYTMYFYHENQKFSVSTSYNKDCSRRDKIYIADTLSDAKSFREYNNCIHRLSSNFGLEDLLMQDVKFCGIEITIVQKEITDRLPAWCIENRIY